MIFADMGAGTYAPVEIDHRLAGHQTIGEGLGTVIQSVRAPMVQQQLLPAALEPASVPVTAESGGRTTTSLIDTSPLLSPGGAPRTPRPLPQPLSQPPGTTVPSPSGPRPPRLPVQPPPAPGVPPAAGLPTSPSPLPGATAQTLPVQQTSQILPGLEQTSSNVKWAIIGGICALGIIGALVILR